MPKPFRLITLALLAQASLLVSGAANAEASGCPKPETAEAKQQQTNPDAPHPDSAVYHEAMQQSVTKTKATLDWVEDPASTLPCGGFYQQPENPNPQAARDPDEADIIISATTADKGADGYTTLSGSVEVYQGWRRFRCDKMRFSDEKKFSELTGNIQLREPGMLLLADRAVMDGQQRYSTFTGTEYILHEQQAHGRASELHITDLSGSYLTIRDTDFTLCPPSAEYWSFDARRLELDKTRGWGKLYSAFFRVADVPVLYIPYLDFPIDSRRKTGLLWPSIATADNRGLDITLPYYINIAPQFDLTLVPRHNGDHGFLQGLEARYKQHYAEWSAGGAYIHNDKRVGDVETADDPTLEERRWTAFVKEEGRFNPNWSSAIDYQAVSDINYYRDWGTTGLDIRKSTNIRREASLHYHDAYWETSATLVDYQTLELDPVTLDVAEEEYRELPEIRYAYRHESRPFRPEPLLRGEATYFDHDALIRATRLYTEPGLAFPMRFAAGEITPAAKVHQTLYRFNSNPAPLDHQEEITVPSATLDGKLFFEREISHNEKALRQTVTPRLFYWHADYEKQSTLPTFDTEETAFSYPQLFRDSRFGSFDRIGDANQLSLALESRIFDSSGRERFFAGLGQIRYFRDRKVTVLASDDDLQPFTGAETAAESKAKQEWNDEVEKRYYRSASDLAAEAHWQLDPAQRISGTLIWDTYQSRQQESSIGYHLSTPQQAIVNATYRYRRIPSAVDANGERLDNRIHQTDLTLYQPINNRWHLFLRWNYDVTRTESIEEMGGVRYEGCCYGVMVAWQRERDTFANNLRISDSADASYQYHWLIQFELKGLGGITHSVTSLIEESIEGYHSSEKPF